MFIEIKASRFFVSDPRHHCCYFFYKTKMQNNVYLMFNFDNRITLTKKLISAKPKPKMNKLFPHLGEILFLINNSLIFSQVIFYLAPISIHIFHLIIIIKEEKINIHVHVKKPNRGDVKLNLYTCIYIKCNQ